MDSHLSDFPIEPARVVPAAGILPAQVARSLVGVDEKRLTRSLEAFGAERVGDVDIEPVGSPYRCASGTAVLSDGREQEPSASPVLWDGGAPRPRIIAVRLNGRRLRAWRVDAKLTQERFAERVREAGTRIGEPNGCTKKKVNTWESGEVAMPTPKYQRALESVTGMPFVALCTPVPPIDPDEATRELTAIASNFNQLMNRMFRYHQYLTR